MSDEAMECAKRIMEGTSMSCGSDWPYGTNLYTLVSPYQLTADRVFSVWYNNEKNYDYSIDPKVDTNTGKLIVQHIMSI